MKNIMWGIIIVVAILYSLYRNHKLKQQYKMEEQEHPELKQMLRVEKSKMDIAEGNTQFYLPIVLKLLFLFIVAILLIYLMTQWKVTYETQTVILFIMFIIYGIIFILIPQKKKNKQVVDNFYGLLKEKYGSVFKLECPPNQMVEGNEFELGSIRNEYQMVFQIEKYHCLLTNYYQEVCKKRYDSDNSYQYYYEKRNNLMEYRYDLSQFHIDHFYELFQTNEVVKRNIEQLESTINMEFTIRDNMLFVTKETVLKYYNENDTHIDIEDVKIFYEMLIKPIQDNL